MTDVTLLGFVRMFLYPVSTVYSYHIMDNVVQRSIINETKLCSTTCPNLHDKTDYKEKSVEFPTSSTTSLKERNFKEEPHTSHNLSQERFYKSHSHNSE